MRTVIACPEDYFTDDFIVYFKNFIKEELRKSFLAESFKRYGKNWTIEEQEKFIEEGISRVSEFKEFAQVGYSLLDVPKNETVIFRLNYPLGNFIEYKITKIDEYDFYFDPEYFQKAMEKYDTDPYFQLLEREI